MGEQLSLEARKAQFEKQVASYKQRVVICAGTGCVANGSIKLYNRLMEVIQSRGLKVEVYLKKETDPELSISLSGCQGFCQMGPLMEIYPEGILYVIAKEEDAEEIVDKTLIKG
jgi:NADH-quinone oxidoreductase subunit F